jgi:PST family polysaccharide transporter
MSLITNVKWVGIAQLVKIFCQLINITILARLIAPDEYGLIAMAGVVVALGFLFRDMGTSAALIQKKNLTEELKNGVFWLNIFVGFILLSFIIISAPIAAQFFSQQKLVPILFLLALSFPISSFASAHLALLERHEKFKNIAIIEALSSLVATILGVGAAYNGWGAYSLVVQALANSILSTILIWNVSSWKPSLHGYRYLSEIRNIFSYSGNLVVFNFINYFYRNADRYIVGKMMPSPVLGAYDLAYKIMLFPVQTLTFTIGRALFPVLTKLQDQSKEFNETFLRVSFYIALFAFPMMGGLWVLRSDFVDIVLGAKWSLVKEILIWLAPVGMLQALGSSTGGVLAAKGRTDILLKLGLLGATLIVSSFIFSMFVGEDIKGFVKNYFIANLINFILSIVVVCNIIKQSFLKYIFSLSSVIFSCAVMCSIGIFLQNLFSISFFIIKILIMVLVYFIFMFFLSKEFRVRIYFFYTLARKRFL